MNYNTREFSIYFWDNPDYNIPDESDLNPPTKKEIKNGQTKQPDKRI